MTLVDGSNFKFMEKTSSGYVEHEHVIYNRRVKVLIDIPSRMTITQFLDNFVEGQRDYIKIVNGLSYVNKAKYDTTYVGTGTEIVFQSTHGATLDIVRIAIRGDVSGDGFINYSDIQALSDYINRGDFSDYAIFYSADLNSDGFVNVNDLTILQSMLY